MQGTGGARVPFSTGTGSRDAGLDLGKLAAFVAVVFIHVGFPETTPAALVWTVIEIARFAVPFFFIVSGYFLARRLSSPVWVAGYVARRIVPAFLFWCLFYHWPEIRDGHAKVLKLLLFSDADHLWFFPALAMSLVLASLTLRIGGILTLSALAIALYGVALACGPEAQMVGVDQLPWDGRLGPLFGLPFVTIGTVLARLPRGPSVAAAASLFVLGIGAQLGEARLLAWETDFVVMTPLLATGAFLFFRSLPTSLWLTRCSRPGRVVLGAYGLHYQLIRMPFAVHSTTSGTFAVVAAVAVISLLVSDIAASYRPLGFAFS